jgi:hypothetical protein
MALRDCKHCWKTVEDEKHYWFCPFGDGVHPASAKKPRGGDDASGSGGSDPGEGNIPPLPDAPGGDAVRLVHTPLEPAMIENQQMLALPAPLEVEDEQKLRRDSVGER